MSASRGENISGHSAKNVEVGFHLAVFKGFTATNMNNSGCTDHPDAAMSAGCVVAGA